RKSVSLVRDPEGSARWSVAIIRDITVQKQAEQELVASNARLQALMDALPVGVSFSMDATCHVIVGNPEFLAQFEVAADENISASSIDASAIGRQFRYWRDGRAMQDHELPLQLAVLQNKQLAPQEIEIELPSGRRWFAEVTASPVRDEAGKVVGGVAVTVDTTERRRTEAALRASERRYRAIFDQQFEYSSLLSPDGRILEISQSVVRLTDVAREEVVGQRFLDGPWWQGLPQTIEKWRQQFDLARRQRGAHRAEICYRAKDGTIRWALSSVTGLRDERDEFEAFLVEGVDITRLKQHEEQITTLLREVNHRSKNMLSVVQAIAHQTVEPAARGFLNSFDDRILALAAAQDVLIQNEWMPVPLSEVVASQLSHFSALVGTRIKWLGPNVLLSAAAAQAISMVLHELATNAAKHGALSGPEGHIALCWEYARHGGRDEFRLSWLERGGSPITVPKRRGFGSFVTHQMLESGIGGKVDSRFDCDGFTWHFTCDVKQLNRNHVATPGIEAVRVTDAV
ncbi:MAG: PAS domain S-box protein, partial [Proteobacteria bacterium]|nr:PAS domain S-box protein [Pseudomonadota bacterium]